MDNNGDHRKTFKTTREMEALPPTDLAPRRPGAGANASAAPPPAAPVAGQDAAPAAPPASLRLHERLGPYQITHFLGKGGMALVYEAVDADGAPVALKVMHESPEMPPEKLERFHREAEAAKRLRRHPHIVTVYDTGGFGLDHYIAMELIPGGRTLAHVLHQGRLPVQEALRIGLAVAKALEYAHSLGIVHRDLKPANVMINEFNEPLLGDFGLVRFEFDDHYDLTLTAVAMGTPKYMSPEQTLSSKKVTHQTDIYSFGLILHEMLTGRLPYDIPPEAGILAIFDIIRGVEPKNPRALRREIPRSLAAILLKLLEKRPEDRYQHMADVVADLRACAEGRRVSVHVPTVFERMDRIIFRHKIAAAIALIAVVAFVGTWRHFRKQIIEERAALIVPGAQATSNARELDSMKRQMAGDAPELSSEERLLQEAHRLIVDQRDLPGAHAKLQELQRYATDPEYADSRDGLNLTARWELARLALAEGNPQRARGEFQALSAAPSLGTARRHMLQFETGVACSMAGDTTEAKSQWLALTRDAGTDTGAGWLAAGALGDIPPETLAEGAPRQMSVFRALGFWVASIGTGDDSKRQAWRNSAREPARNALPWLYYYLEIDDKNSPSQTPSPEGSTHP
ncbi:MAG: hypothetical protein A3K19_29095 [Lentisphaerae bacterium RIFOXYB12_FULL_65_16]|nr:MAG: hypothetical protein A3K18_04485 [Lentisphaerae bacterium RIFOXYA12_64_32]OGV88355.1 MAG: hypothetical protein A3K19_29095 [Lentisphaerae bacterium RIFOXYB12_FULL_65_16]